MALVSEETVVYLEDKDVRDALLYAAQCKLVEQGRGSDEFEKNVLVNVVGLSNGTVEGSVIYTKK